MQNAPPSDRFPNYPLCDLEKPFEDVRGVIQPLVDENLGGCALITSKKGARRANHYHKSDWHYCYLLSGQLEYLYRPVGSNDAPKKVVVEPGQLFYSPPMVEHVMHFTEDSTFIVLSGKPRQHEDYEDDVVRVPDLVALAGAR
jgi:quercetin dioxygenase-like cupin family protein